MASARRGGGRHRLALYGEVTGSVDELELEGKLIIDKRLGNLLLAANFVAEHEWEYGIGETEKELHLDGYLGASWFFTPRFALGIEAWNANIIADGTWEHSAFFLGCDVLHRGWMLVTLTVLPQLPAFKPSEGAAAYVLTSYERFQARLLSRSASRAVVACGRCSAGFSRWCWDWRWWRSSPTGR
jgi:hypothetical protein